MSSQEYAAALDAVDVETQQQLLRSLIDGSLLDHTDLSTTAELCLRAFCDSSRPLVTRRWSGIALACMLNRHTTSTAWLKQHMQQLPQLGEIILSQSAAEETKIVAGLIIREGLARHIKFLTFWPNEKVQSNAPIFPTQLDSQWMHAFQGFLDVLHDLSIVQMVTDPAMQYTVALIADRYRWAADSNAVAIAITQQHLLTIVIPAPRVQDLHFVDVPLRQIQYVECQRSILHDSQSQEARVAPWNAVLHLRTKQSSYSVNSSKQDGDKLTLMYENMTEAQQFGASIEELSLEQWQRTAQDNDCVNMTVEEERTFSEAHRGVREVDSQAQLRGQKATLHKALNPLDDNEAVSQDGLEYDQRLSEQGDGTSALHVAAIGLPLHKTTSPSTSLARAAPKADARGGTEDLQQGSSQDAVPEPTVVKALPSIRVQHKSIDRSTLVTTTRLPRVLKVEDTKRMSDTLDPYEIPHEESVKTSKTKRKATKSIVYHAGQTSEEDGSGSEYAEPKPKRSKSTTRKVAIGKAVVATTRGGKKGKSKKRSATLEAGRQTLHKDTKSYVPSSRVIKPPEAVKQCADGAANHDPSREDVPNDSQMVLDEGLPGSPASHGSPVLHTEVTLLEKLNPAESISKVPDHAARTSHDTSMAHSNRSSHGSARDEQLATKTPEKRIKPTENGGPSISPRAAVSMTKTLRILEDPSSPCAQSGDAGYHDARSAGIMAAPGMQGASSFERSVLKTKTQEMADRRQTPVHHDSHSRQHEHYVELALLSSNSKPTPGCPHADSTAISGHADCEQVDWEQEHGKHEIARNDPFSRRSSSAQLSSFTRRLTGELSDLGNNLGDKPTQGDLGATDIPLTSWELEQKSPPHKQTHRPRQPQDTRGETVVTSPRETLDSKDKSLITKRPAKLRKSCKGGARGSDKHTAIHHSAPPISEKNPVPQLPIPSKPTVVPLSARSQSMAVDMEGDTLVDILEDGPDLPPNPATVHFGSSPPPFGHPSSPHSSTSACSSSPGPPTDPAMPTSEAEDLAWRAALQPHQRSVHDQLLHVSNRVMRHIVDAETQVEDIVEEYQKEAEKMVQGLVKRHAGSLEDMNRGIEEEKRRIVRVVDETRRKVERDRAYVKSLKV